MKMFESECKELINAECAIVERHYEKEIERLRAELAACREDAERYRWLRNPKNSLAGVGLFWSNEHRYEFRPEVMDAAIDAARKEVK
jgi:hypothetical protein